MYVCNTGTYVSVHRAYICTHVRTFVRMYVMRNFP